jgi:hypothetical protein
VLRVAVMIYTEVSDMRRQSRPSGDPKTITHQTISDPWIAGLYPPAFALFMLVLTCRMECPSDNSGPPPTCAQQHERVLADIDEGLTTGRLSFVADTALSPAQREVRTAVTAGDPRTAAALWDAVRDDQPESVFLSVALFLLTTCS